MVPHRQTLPNPRPPFRRRRVERGTHMGPADHRPRGRIRRPAPV